MDSPTTPAYLRTVDPPRQIHHKPQLPQVPLRLNPLQAEMQALILHKDHRRHIQAEAVQREGVPRRSEIDQSTEKTGDWDKTLKNATAMRNGASEEPEGKTVWDDWNMTESGTIQKAPEQTEINISSEKASRSEKTLKNATATRNVEAITSEKTVREEYFWTMVEGGMVQKHGRVLLLSFRFLLYYLLEVGLVTAYLTRASESAAARHRKKVDRSQFSHDRSKWKQMQLAIVVSGLTLAAYAHNIIIRRSTKVVHPLAPQDHHAVVLDIAKSGKTGSIPLYAQTITELGSVQGAVSGRGYQSMSGILSTDLAVFASGCGDEKHALAIGRLERTMANMESSDRGKVWQEEFARSGCGCGSNWTSHQHGDACTPTSSILSQQPLHLHLSETIGVVRPTGWGNDVRSDHEICLPAVSHFGRAVAMGKTNNRHSSMPNVRSGGGSHAAVIASGFTTCRYSPIYGFMVQERFHTLLDKRLLAHCLPEVIQFLSALIRGQVYGRLHTTAEVIVRWASQSLRTFTKTSFNPGISLDEEGNRWQDPTAGRDDEMREGANLSTGGTLPHFQEMRSAYVCEDDRDRSLSDYVPANESTTSNGTVGVRAFGTSSLNRSSKRRYFHTYSGYERDVHHRLAHQ
ncbi:hypothetical protein BU17DRAFT_97092 [Hysterangium stoloniferum]|nr:hypothetical protein BU17DRAFT_97092 [Hysterangium stoloniferum]